MLDTAQKSPSPLAALASSLAAAVRAIIVAENDVARTQRDAVVAFLVRVASAGILYLSQIVLARWMGTTEYGIYVFVWTWVLLLGAISHLGLATALIRLIPQFKSVGDHSRLLGLIRASRWIAIACGSIVALLGALGLYVLDDALQDHYVLPAYLALVCIPLYALGDVQDGIGRGSAMMVLGLVPPYIVRPLLLLVAMAAANVAGMPMNAQTAAIAAIASTWLASLGQLLLVRRQVERPVSGVAPTYEVKGWLTFSMPMLVIIACEIIMQNTDLLVVSRYLPPSEVGIYFAASKTMSLVLFVHYAVGSAVANRFAALHAAGDRDKLKAFVRDAVNWTFWPSLVAALVLLAFGKPLLWLFGPEFTAGYPIMFVLVIGFLARASMGPADYLLNMLGEQSINAAILLVSAILNIALAFALVPRFGTLGAASSTSIALLVGALLNYVIAKRRLEIEVSIWNNFGKSSS